MYKKIYKREILSGILICSLLFAVFYSVAASSYSDINVKKTQEMLLENPEACILLDVRTVNLYSGEISRVETF